MELIGPRLSTTVAALRRMDALGRAAELAERLHADLDRPLGICRAATRVAGAEIVDAALSCLTAPHTSP